MRAVLLWMACGATLSAQIIEGVAYDRLTGSPIAGVYVSALVGGANERVVSASDPMGHFRLMVPRQNYINVAVVRSGYLRKSLTIAPDQGTPMTDMRIALTPQAVIAGRIEDEDGFPMQEVHVRALRLSPANDRNKLQFVQAAYSDDLGRFRMSGLPAGRFFLQFLPPSAMPVWDTRYAGEFYPGTLEAGEATPIEIKAGQEINGANLRMTRREGVSVSGRLVLPEGGKIPQMSSIGVYAQGAGMKWRAAFAPVNEDGTFLMRHIQAGSYTLHLNSCCGAPGDIVGNMPLTVGASGIQGLEFPCQVSKAFDLTGKVTLDGTTPASGLSIRLQDLSGQRKVAQSGTDGAFVVKGLLPSEYQFYVDGASSGVTLRPLTPLHLGEREISIGEYVALDGPPGVPLSIRMVELSGTQPLRLQEADGRPVAGGAIRLAGGAPWMDSSVRTGADGGAEMNLAPGEYHIYATADVDDLGLLDDPDFRAAHQADFATAHVVTGKNAKLVLTLPAR